MLSLILFTARVPGRPLTIFFALGAPVLSSRAGDQARAAPSMAEKTVLVGVIPETTTVGPADQVSWIATEGQLKVEFDPNRCPFSSNIFQAPAGIRLLSGPARAGTKAGAYRYRLWLNEQLIGSGEIILRES